MARPGNEPWILLIDPETVRRRDRAAALERRGCRVFPASDAEVAGAVLRTQRVDVVVLHGDASVPPETVGSVPRSRVSRSREGDPALRAPMIVLTAAIADPAPAGSADPELRAEGGGRRLLALLMEPVEPRRLEQVIRNLVARSRPADVPPTIVSAAPRPTRPDVSDSLRSSG